MRRFCLVAGLLALAACAEPHTEEDFLCGAQEGQPCRSISEVDGTAPTTTSAASVSKPVTTAAVATGPISPNSVRLAEKTGRMWIAPYNDAGFILEESTVRFVVRNARWSEG